MKKMLSVLLSVVMLLSLIPFYAVPTAAEGETQHEPVFSVSVSGNTFTITRSESWKQQTVSYRTVCVTAIEGIHFTRATGTLTFGVGETSKTVIVTETAVGDIPVRYRYQSGYYREYRLEVLDSFGFVLAMGTRRINYGDNYKFNNSYVNSNVTDLLLFNGNGSTGSYVDVNHSDSNNTFIQVKDSGYKQAVHTISTGNLFSQSGIAPRSYLSAIGDKIYAAVRFEAKEENDGYQYIQILADSPSSYDADDSNGTVSTPSVSYYKACFERDHSTTANGNAEWLAFPHRYDYKDRTEENSAGINSSHFASGYNYLWEQKYRNDSVKAANSGAILLDPVIQNLNIRFDAAGSGSDTWDFRNLTARFALCDDTAPYPVDALYYTQGSFIKNTPITITICFNEIVRPFGCVLKTTWGDLPVISTTGYANVLSFCGPITANVGTELRITGIEGDVTDLFGNDMTASVSKNLSVTVAQGPTPTVSNGVYQISNAAELYAYADMLNTYPNRSGKLVADIDMSNSELSGFTAMAGTNGFTGTFDGDGHKIMNLQNVSGTSNGLCGLFGYISAGGRVQNLEIDISFTAPLGSSGAICGLNLGTVENCIVSGKIENSIIDSAQSTSSNCFGGVVGDNRGNVIHCLALNEISNTWQNLKAGGIVGYNSGTVESCCFYGVFSSSKTITRGAVCGENASNGTITNCAARNLNSNYYSYAIGSDNGTTTNTLYMSTAEFESGKACYEVLNNGVSDGTQSWYQNIDNENPHDDCPQLSGGTVYKHANIYTNAIVHTLSYVAAVAAGCENEGHPEYWVCTFDGCGKIFADENAQNETTLEALTIPVLGHDWSSMWYFDSAGHRHKCTRCNAVKDEAAHICSAPDYEWSSDNTQVTAKKYCDVCHSLLDRETVSTTSDYSTVICTQGGIVTYTATFTKDGFTTQTKQVSMDALGHDYVDTVTAPTCTEQGYTTHTCSRCGDSYVDSYTDALGHDWQTDWGYGSDTHWHYCSRCNEKKDEALHSLVGAPTWSWDGIKYANAIFECSVCNMDVGRSADITYSVSGNLITATATVSLDGNTYTDTNTGTGLTLGENTADIVAHNSTYYYFVPSEDSFYRFESTGDYDPKITVKDDGGNQIAYNDDGGEGQNFLLYASLEAGKLYIIELYSFSGTGDLTVFISKATTYAITVDSAIEHGRVWVEDGNGNELTLAASGQKLYICQKPDSGYRLESVTATDSSGNPVDLDGSLGFTMPESDITVSAQFGSNALSVGENTVCIQEDTSQIYSFTPSQDGVYRFYSVGDYDPQITVKDDGGNQIAYDDDGGEDDNFLLVASLEAGKLYEIILYSYEGTGDLTVFISKEITHAITVDSAVEHGRVWVEDDNGNELTLAASGRKLYIRQEPDSGYCLKSVTVTDSSGNPVDLDGSLGFTMLESDITVSAQFGSNALSVGENTVYIQKSTSQIYSFTPSQDGDYRFYSVGDYDPRITVKNNGGAAIGTHDDYDRSHGNRNFNLPVSLEAGKTYTVEIYSYSYNGYNTGLMTMFIEKDGLQYDINSDGVEDINDIGFILSASVGNTEMNWAQVLKADLNSDGTVDGFDAAELDRILASVNTAKGDVNQDGDIGLADYAMTRAHISGVAVDSNTPANLLDKSYLTAEYDGIKDNYPNGTIITQQYYCADYDGDKAVDAFDLFYLDKRINNIA